jgi:hypothetical protein
LSEEIGQLEVLPSGCPVNGSDCLQGGYKLGSLQILIFSDVIFSDVVFGRQRLMLPHLNIRNSFILYLFSSPFYFLSCCVLLLPLQLGDLLHPFSLHLTVV